MGWSLGPTPDQFNIAKGPSLYHPQNNWVDFENGQFCDVQYYSCADIVGGSEKDQKYADVT